MTTAARPSGKHKTPRLEVRIPCLNGLDEKIKERAHRQGLTVAQYVKRLIVEDIMAELFASKVKR